MRTALVILLLFAAVAKGQIPIYKLDTNRQVHYLAGTTAILVDSVEKFITNEVLSGEKDHLFVRYNSVANQKNKNYTYWLRFAVQPIGSVNNWVMLVEEIDHNDLYNDRLESFVLGPDRKLISSDQAGPLIKRSAKNSGILRVLMDCHSRQISRWSSTLRLAILLEVLPGTASRLYSTLRFPIQLILWHPC